MYELSATSFGEWSSNRPALKLRHLTSVCSWRCLLRVECISPVVGAGSVGIAAHELGPFVPAAPLVPNGAAETLIR